MDDIENSKSKNPQNRQNSVTSVDKINILCKFMILCQNVSQFIANECSKLPFPVHFFGWNVTQFISNDGLKILCIKKTYKIARSSLKMDVFLLCAPELF